jgi:hypothetical protein
LTPARPAWDKRVLSPQKVAALAGRRALPDCLSNKRGAARSPATAAIATRARSCVLLQDHYAGRSGI